MKLPSEKLLLFVPPVVVVVLFAPTLSFSLMGDDFQWVQHAHRASHQLRYLFADLDSFYRPTTTWTLALDRLLWDHKPWGFHLTNVLLHAAVAYLLAVVGRRLGLETLPAVVAASLWGVAPFTAESAVSVAIRFEDILLLCWLGLVLVWPSPGVRLRPAVVASLAGLAMLSKETSVVTPALVLVLAWGFSRKPWKESLLLSLPFVAASVFYAGFYFWVFPGDKNYFQYNLELLSKIPHSLAIFFHMEPWLPANFHLTPAAALAFVVTSAFVIIAFNKRHPAGVVGTFLLFAPSLPTLFVPYLPSRYLVAPYAGFLLLVFATYATFTAALSTKVRRWAGGVAGGLALLVFLAHVFTVRADLRDWTRVSKAHRHLLAHAEVVAGHFPMDRPVAVVRADGTNVLREIARSEEGAPKLFFVRGGDPGGLIDVGALFEWVLARENLEVRPVVEPPGGLKGRGAVLLYTASGFRWVNQDEPDLGVAAGAWRRHGFPVRVIEVRKLPRWSF